MSVCGAATAEKVVYEMKKMTWERRFRKGYEAKEGLCEILAKMLNVGDSQIKTGTVPSVILMVGVNGVGKTTTIGKSSLPFGLSVPVRTSSSTRKEAILHPLFLMASMPRVPVRLIS